MMDFYRTLFTLFGQLIVLSRKNSARYEGTPLESTLKDRQAVIYYVRRSNSKPSKLMPIERDVIILCGDRKFNPKLEKKKYIFYKYSSFVFNNIAI